MIAAAEDASPLVGTPAAGRAYLATRESQLDPATEVESGFLPTLRDAPGFLEFFLAETAEGDVVSISIFTD